MSRPSRLVWFAAAPTPSPSEPLSLAVERFERPLAAPEPVPAEDRARSSTPTSSSASPPCSRPTRRAGAVSSATGATREALSHEQDRSKIGQRAEALAA